MIPASRAKRRPPCLLLNKKQMKKNRGAASKDKAEKNWGDPGLATREEQVMDWFLSLDKSAQAALVGSVASSLVIGIVAVLGFWITYMTSTAANRKIADITKSAKVGELTHLSKLRAADYRMK
jgi:hypothetical protein